ncbi:hypothetical protein F5148DRAFT_1229261 [Russula earlei]|uniref:Uncharacterized protein n=1 Tax=Russula earlei TaxID=71964 RepID=A0ACC0U105_9AGAM|nr:hypothetical protein F5148DRAFT_1229261 [Russula earlei]
MRISAVVAFISLAFGVAPSISVRTNPSRRSVNPQVPHGQGGTPVDSHRGDNSQEILTFEHGDPKMKDHVTQGKSSQNPGGRDEHWHNAEILPPGKSYDDNNSRRVDRTPGGNDWRVRSTTRPLPRRDIFSWRAKNSKPGK